VDLLSASTIDDHEATPAGAPQPAWFEQLYSSSHARIYNLAARIVGDRDDAADITQEVFLRAYTHPPDEQGLRNPEPWLYRVTVNACYDHLRRRTGRATTPLEHVGEIASSRDGFASAEMTHAVEEALGSLNLRYRTALVLRDLHGLGTGEVADVMGVSKATARVLLHRSRVAFRRAFSAVAPEGALPAVGLAVLLPTLAVPAALQTPPLVGALTAAAPVALAALPHAAASLPIAGPIAGLFAKIGGAVGMKAAVVVAAALVVTGGTVATYDLATDARDRAGTKPPGPTPALTQTRAGAPAVGAAGQTGSETRKRPAPPDGRTDKAGGQGSSAGGPSTTGGASAAGGAGSADGAQAPAPRPTSAAQTQTGGDSGSSSSAGSSGGSSGGSGEASGGGNPVTPPSDGKP
jgi:RNA polymerase sigma-70 factor (ECF subfamily)